MLAKPFDSVSKQRERLQFEEDMGGEMESGVKG